MVQVAAPGVHVETPIMKIEPRNVHVRAIHPSLAGSYKSIYKRRSAALLQDARFSPAKSTKCNPLPYALLEIKTTETLSFLPLNNRKKFKE